MAQENTALNLQTNNSESSPASLTSELNNNTIATYGYNTTEQVLTSSMVAHPSTTEKPTLKLKSTELPSSSNVAIVTGTLLTLKPTTTVITQNTKPLTISKEIVALEGDSINIECPLNGTDISLYTWLKIDQAKHIARTARVASCIYTIHRLTLEDSGVYQCLAAGSEGNGTRQIYTNIKLTVLAVGASSMPTVMSSEDCESI